MEIKKYVDIQNLRESDVVLNGEVTRERNDVAFEKGDQIQITTKIDGSNASIAYDAVDGIQSFSRKQKLEYNNTLNGFYEYALGLPEKAKEAFKESPNYRVFGEWMYRKKSNKILYNEDMKMRWLVYSIYDTDIAQWLGQDKVKAFCEKSGLEYIEILYEGPFVSWDHCREFMHKSKYGSVQEGVVVRNLSKINSDENHFPWILKIVNEEFAESMIKLPKEVDPEKEAAKEKAKELMSQVVTVNRVEKLLQKAIDNKELPEKLTEKDMSLVARVIPKAVYEDVMKEEPEVMRACGEYGSKQCSSIAMAVARKLILG